MRSMFGRFWLVILFSFILSTQSFASPSYVPDKAHDAIALAQGNIVVKVPTVDGNEMVAYAQGVLVGPDLVITALHALPEFHDLVFNPVRTKITFNGIAVKKVEAVVSRVDFAILRLEKTPVNMKPITLADSVELYQYVYAEMSGTLPIAGVHDGQGVKFTFDRLPFRAYVVNRIKMIESFMSEEVYGPAITMFYLDQDAKHGFSGGAFVNSEGALVGMGLMGDGGYTIILDVAYMKAVLKNYLPKTPKN